MTDGNGKGILSSEVGLINYDEAIHAGGYFTRDYSNSEFYLYNGSYPIWTMSPGGFHSSSVAVEVVITKDGWVGHNRVNTSSTLALLPVINLKSDVLATGTGTSSDPYVIQTK